MKKLEISQMENLQGGSPKTCNLIAGALAFGGAINPAIGATAGLFALGCLLYDY